MGTSASTAYVLRTMSRELRALTNTTADGVGLDRRIVRLGIPALGTLAVEPLYRLVDTAIVGRIGTDEDMAGVAIYLASRAGDYVVGQTIVVDGGVTLARG